MTSFRKELTEACNASPSGVSFWGEIGIKGERRKYIAAICHGQFTTYPKRKVYENISNHYAKKIHSEHKKYYKEWISFVLNDSPWAQAFVTKRFGTAVQHNVEINMDVHPSIAMGGIIAMRMASEMPAIMPTYANLRRAKVSVKTAFLTSTLFDEEALEIMPYRDLHSLWNKGCCLESVFEFMNTGFKPLSGSTLKQGGTRFRVFIHSYGDKFASLEANIALLPSAKVVKIINNFGRLTTKCVLPSIGDIAKDISAYYGGNDD